MFKSRANNILFSLTPDADQISVSHSHNVIVVMTKCDFIDDYFIILQKFSIFIEVIILNLWPQESSVWAY